MADRIRVYVKRPGEAPELKTIDNTLEALQQTVGGYIETVTVTNDLVIICNEEGRIFGMEDNCEICGVYFVGTVILAGVDGEEFADVPEEETLPRLLPDLWQPPLYGA